MYIYIFFSVFCGLSMKTGKTDILKAVLEAICFQTRDILEAMYLDCGQLFAKNLLVDGGMSNNDFLMQLQADLTGKPVGRYFIYLLFLMFSQLRNTNCRYFILHKLFFELIFKPSYIAHI